MVLSFCLTFFANFSLVLLINVLRIKKVLYIFKKNLALVFINKDYGKVLSALISASSATVLGLYARIGKTIYCSS